MFARSCAAVAAVTLVTLTGGCSSSSGPAAAPTGTPSPTPAPVRTTVVTGSTHFASPSGNISCFLDAGSVRCDIAERDWQPPPKPPGCDVDYGQGILLDADGARFVCAGDTVLGAQRRLPYGEALRAGPLVCTSAATGMRCEDVDGRHGFTLSRASYRIF